jgi:hypothetical protein
MIWRRWISDWRAMGVPWAEQERGEGCACSRAAVCLALAKIYRDVAGILAQRPVNSEQV